MPIDVEAVVVSNTRLSDDYNVLALAAPDLARCARPGQFVMIKPGTGTDPLLRRPFSVFEILRDSSGTPTGISLLNKRIGRGTARLYSARPGSRFPCLGPLGQPFSPIAPPEEAWLVAGGVGLAPFLTLADALRELGTATVLFYGARTDAELFYVDEFERMGARVEISTEDGSRGTRGLVTSLLERALARSQSAAVHMYACGPTPMMSAVARVAGAHGCACDVSLEQVMGCGLGGCYSCVVAVRDETEHVHFVRSCLEGPVFDSRRIAWDALGD
jgi:dihydroorotate dehydrogenase electron transfer subunit